MDSYKTDIAFNCKSDNSWNYINFPSMQLCTKPVYIFRIRISPHEPAIGVILSESMKYLATGNWWLALFPGLSLLIIVLLFDIVGENIKKLLNPASANN